MYGSKSRGKKDAGNPRPEGLTLKLNQLPSVKNVSADEGIKIIAAFYTHHERGQRCFASKSNLQLRF